MRCWSSSRTTPFIWSIPNVSIGLTSNLWFSIVSVLVLTVLIAFVTERTIEPRLGKYKPESSAAEGGSRRRREEENFLPASRAV